MTQPKHTPLYAYNQYVTDKESFGFDENGARIGETPNFWIDAETPERAALIAAAPDLLEALTVLVEEKADYMRRNNLGDPEREPATKKARAAIAKATGAQP